MSIKNFVNEHFKHFNSASLVDAAKGYEKHLNEGKKMLISIAGAMSTAEIGKSLAEMIRGKKVHLISCTGANLEEDLMNLVAHNHYKRVPNYRDLTPEDEKELLTNGLNRVTDTCIPEGEAFRKLQKHVFSIWKKAEEEGKRYFPHEFLYHLILSGELEKYYEIPEENSWMIAAANQNLPMVVPGWEDSTLGNIFASYCIKGELNPNTMKNGIEYMIYLANYYTKNAGIEGIGFFSNWRRNCWRFPNLCSPNVISRFRKKRHSFLELFLSN
jgi:deoxyhypusine synthase